MVATIPLRRAAAPYTAPPELPDVPRSARERGRIWSDVVFQAVLALQGQLRNRDAAVVMAAATTLLEMERTRMRHGTTLAGSEAVSEAQEQFEADNRFITPRPAARPAAKAPKPVPTTPAPVGTRSEAQALGEHAVA